MTAMQVNSVLSDVIFRHVVTGMTPVVSPTDGTQYIIERNSYSRQEIFDDLADSGTFYSDGEVIAALDAFPHAIDGRMVSAQGLAVADILPGEILHVNDSRSTVTLVKTDCGSGFILCSPAEGDFGPDRRLEPVIIDGDFRFAGDGLIDVRGVQVKCKRTRLEYGKHNEYVSFSPIQSGLRNHCLDSDLMEEFLPWLVETVDTFGSRTIPVDTVKKMASRAASYGIDFHHLWFLMNTFVSQVSNGY